MREWLRFLFYSRTRCAPTNAILPFSYLFKRLDSRLGFGILRRSTSCIHAVVRGNDMKGQKKKPGKCKETSLASRHVLSEQQS